ncbi:hypothetical protein BOTBODRAFT_177039 [Botryobasidium botryosum FD-172 SS1]|uniref:non-specific serine/threonine protein kinase n=1 Tax=Botryobasidium botryosum (strain FD-172 SS1) TaxID=930990 RepID=A0A067MIB8_BOTB1|nr:hypothetical protein BOTBODRAFT_177039 [Botryobasidium botryosum FD-172 SS1]
MAVTRLQSSRRAPLPPSPPSPPSSLSTQKASARVTRSQSRRAEITAPSRFEPTVAGGSLAGSVAAPNHAVARHLPAKSRGASKTAKKTRRNPPRPADSKPMEGDRSNRLASARARKNSGEAPNSASPSSQAAKTRKSSNPQISRVVAQPHAPGQSAELCSSMRVPAISATPRYSLPLAYEGYVISKIIGRGGSGIVCRAKSASDVSDVAIKLQNLNLPIDVLRREIAAYFDLKGVFGVPTMIKNGVARPYRYLVLEQLGPSLADLLQAAGRLSIRAVAGIGRQVLERLRDIHGRNVVHRDIKPGNILLGLGSQSSTMYLVDFGVSTFWLMENDTHRPPRDGCRFFGTLEYGSIRSHNGGQVARRDDIECFGLCLIHLLRGDLPWMSTPRSKDPEWILSQKLVWSSRRLCARLPLIFAELLDYARGLQFDDRPNYEHWIHIFNALESLGQGESLSEAIMRHLPSHHRGRDE